MEPRHSPASPEVSTLRRGPNNYTNKRVLQNRILGLPLLLGLCRILGFTRATVDGMASLYSDWIMVPGRDACPLGSSKNVDFSLYGSFQNSGALVQTPKNRALIRKAPTERTPQFMETALWTRISYQPTNSEPVLYHPKRSPTPLLWESLKQESLESILGPQIYENSHMVTKFSSSPIFQRPQPPRSSEARRRSRRSPSGSWMARAPYFWGPRWLRILLWYRVYGIWYVV